MRKNRKQFLAMLLCLIMCLSLLPVSTRAENQEIEEAVAELQEMAEPAAELQEMTEPAAELQETEEPAADSNEVPEINEEPEQPAEEETGDGETEVTPEDLTEEPPQALTEPEEQPQPETEEQTEDLPSQEAVTGNDAEGTPEATTVEQAEVEEQPAAQREEEQTKAVTVTFLLTPEEAEVTLYTKDAQEEKTVIEPEEDGTYLLFPGEYFYSLIAEGFISVDEERLYVEKQEESEEPIEIKTEMKPQEETSIEQEETAAGPEEDKASSEASLMASADLFDSASGFKDVSNPSDYFYDPVYWAVDHGITTGRTSTTFDPYGFCTRGHIVTFLWRAMDKPGHSIGNPFSDVSSSDGFYDAVLWAYENGITTGQTATTFGPWNSCTRGQIVTFLWRAMGKPEPTGRNPFTDVKASDGFYKAVLWAVEKGITTGRTATTFDPWATCTRGKAVTFLYRAMK